MIATETKKSRIRHFALIGLFFCIACVIQIVDDHIDTPELKRIMGLTTQFLFFGILAYWTVSIVSRVSVKRIRIGLILTISLMALLLFIRHIKYNIFFGNDVTRYLWYSYYVPQCLAPVMLMITLIGASKQASKPFAKQWYLMFLPAAALIILVFTNDLHQTVFSFPKGLFYANKIYEWGPGFYIILAWIVGMYIADGILLYIKCRISYCRRKAWIPFVLFIGCFFVCIIREIFNPLFLNMPETVTFSVVVMCESLIRVGFIPSNTEHAKFFDMANISACIANNDLSTVLRSKNAPELTYEQAQAAASSGKILLSENMVLRAREIRGGEVYWTEDISFINKINSELAETNETLSEETDLIAAENKLKEQRSRIEEQNKLYEGIFSVLRPHLKKIKTTFSKVKTDEDCDKALYLALIYGVYLKRRSNLAMLGKDGKIQFAELVYSVRESADALSFGGAISSVTNEGDGIYTTAQITFMYEFFEDCIECALPDLSACLVRLTANNEQLSCRVALENATSCILPDWREDGRKNHGASLSLEEQDGTLYATLSLMTQEDAK